MKDRLRAFPRSCQNDDDVLTEFWNKHANWVSLLQNAGLFVGQLDHGHLPQGMIPDPRPRESARHDILADAPDSKTELLPRSVKSNATSYYPGNQDPHKSLQSIRSSNSRSRLPRDQRSTTEPTEIHGKENPNQLPLSVSFPGATPARRVGSFRGYAFVMIFLAGVITPGQCWSKDIAAQVLVFGKRLETLTDELLVDDDLLILSVGGIEADVFENALEDRVQAASADVLGSAVD